MPFDPLLGYVVRTQDEWETVVGDHYTTESSGIIIDQNQPSPTLDVLRTMSRTAKGLDDDGAGTYGSGFVRTSSGAALQNLLEPFIGPPLTDTPSTVVLPLGGAGLLTAGNSVTLDSDGALGALPWILQADVALPGNGTFAYSVPGPKAAAAASTWSKATVFPGWTTAGPNPDAAVAGRFAETPAEYRLRFAQATKGTRLLAAILAVPGVTSARIFENFTDVPDAFWGATHWVEALVEGGDDQAIAEAMQIARTFTVHLLGNVSVIVLADGYEDGQITIRFSRPTLIDVWVSQTITKGEGYSADTSATAALARENAIIEQLITVGNSRPTGLDLTGFNTATITSATPEVPGIANIKAFVGLVFPPLDDDVVAGPRDKLQLDPARIILTGV